MMKKSKAQKGDTSVEVTPPPHSEGDSSVRGRPSPSTVHGGEVGPLIGEGDADVNVGGEALAEGGGPHDMGTVESPEDALELEEAEAHPCLLNEDILDMIFKRIVNQSGPSSHVLADIQNVRLVCQPWRNSMTRVYRQIRSAVSFPWAGNWLHKLTFTGFVESMRASDMIPVQKYKLFWNVFRNVPPRITGDFFRICGPGLVSLDMTIEPSDAKRITEHLQKALPPGWGMMKMKTLGFHIREGTGEGKLGQEMGTVDMAGLLLDAGKTLREFELSCSNSHYSTDTDPLITLEEHLGQLIATRMPKTVKKFILKMGVTITGLAFDILAKGGLSLESFEFHVHSLAESGSGSLYKFLESQAATLKSLRVEYPSCNDTGILVSFPRLGQLLYLELSDVSVTETDFAKSFPKLHRLDFDRIHADDAVESLLSSIDTTAQSVKVLRFPCTYNKPFWAHLQKFAQCFPTITELHIRLHNEVPESLTEIFKYFVNIECLDIYFAGSRDGLDVDFDSIFCGDHGESLLNLTKLKKLVLQKDRYCYTGLSLTDDSAECVFLKMEELRELHLPKGTEFSPECEDLLREKLVVLQIGDGH